MSKLSVAVNGSDHIAGNQSAACTFVEYGDYQCPACGEAQPVVRQLQESFGERMRFVFRHFPLSELHPYAEHAAEAAEFSATGDQFWAMHDLLYLNQEDLRDHVLLALAEQLRLPAQALQRVLSMSSYAERIKSDMSGGIRSGVNGTPTFFINGLRHDGQLDFLTLSASITFELEKNV